MAVHVNHGIRGEDADAVRDLSNICETAGIPLEIVRCNLELIAKKRKQSMEEAGQKYPKRRLRGRHRNMGQPRLLWHITRMTMQRHF